MNRRIKIVFLFILLFLMTPTVTSADAHKSTNSSCAEVNAAVADYEGVMQELKSIDCENTDDVEEMSICNTNNNKKAYLLSKLFKLNDDRPECRSSTLSGIIKDNKDECHSVLDSSIKDISNNILTIFYIIAPFLLIIFGSIDFAKIMAANDPHRIVKHRRDFVRRVLAMLGVYLLPVIVNFIIGLNISGASLDGNVYACNKSLNYNVNTWETTYVPRTNSSSSRVTSVNSTGAQAILDAAAIVHQKYVDEKWTYSLGQLIYNDIKSSYNISSHTTCCATFVGHTFYIAGIFSEEEISSYGYNSAPGTMRFLKSKGWIRIDNYEDLQPGDIVFEYDSFDDPGHVQIYYGDGKWYNAGSTNAIGDYDGRVSPYSSNDSSIFVGAYRMP